MSDVLPLPLKSMPKADPIAAATSILVLILSILQVPSHLGLSAELTTAIGSGVVLVAAAGRAIYRAVKGAVLELQDPIAAAIGGVLLILSLVGFPEAVQIDPDMVATLASLVASIFTVRRAKAAVVEAQAEAA